MYEFIASDWFDQQIQLNTSVITTLLTTSGSGLGKLVYNLTSAISWSLIVVCLVNLTGDSVYQIFFFSKVKTGKDDFVFNYTDLNTRFLNIRKLS